MRDHQREYGQLAGLSGDVEANASTLRQLQAFTIVETRALPSKQLSIVIPKLRTAAVPVIVQPPRVMVGDSVRACSACRGFMNTINSVLSSFIFSM